MQIKDVSKQTGLSIKTIRFYEERGLICPKLEYRNGKNFRDYQDADIRQLHMVAVLRKCLFSIDQIKTMIDHPELTPDVFTEYRIAVLTQRDLLKILAEKAETLDPEALDGPEVLARRLTITAAPLPLPTTDMDPHFGRFDPETPEQRQAAYLKWQKRYKHRYLRRYLPCGLTVLILLIITVIHVSDHMNFNTERFMITKSTIEQADYVFTANQPGNDIESRWEGWYFYEDSTYGMYTADRQLLSKPQQLPALKRPEDITSEEIVLDVVHDYFSTSFMGEKQGLSARMEKWVAEDPSLEYRQLDVRSNIFVQQMASVSPIEVEGTVYYLVLYFRQSPILYTIKELGVLYLCTAFIWGVWFAFSTSKNYGFRVHFLRSYGPRGTWNDAIIHIDEDTGTATMLTKGTTGSGNLLDTHRKD